MIRFSDILFSFLGLIFLSPFIVIISLFIFFEDRHRIFYLQERVGKNGNIFKLFKFRTMRPDSDRKGLLTVGGRDPRITRAGYYLRKYKLDEIPQLINVITGTMSLVGPRPEVKKYTDLYTDEQRKVLAVRPGITDIASIEYIDENLLLANTEEPEKLYIEKIMPDKIRLNMQYIENRGLYLYFAIIFRTLLSVIKH